VAIITAALFGLWPSVDTDKRNTPPIFDESDFQYWYHHPEQFWADFALLHHHYTGDTQQRRLTCSSSLALQPPGERA
jgi:hypothetical protein